MKNWKELAKEYYFDSHLSIKDIAAMTDVSRQSISGYLKTLPEFPKEKDRRKKQNAAKRKDYKKVKNREYRSAAQLPITAETMKREHDLAALELSHEIYH